MWCVMDMNYVCASHVVLCGMCYVRAMHVDSIFSFLFIMVQLQLAAVILQLAASFHLLCASFNLFLIINFHFQNPVGVVVGVWGTWRWCRWWRMRWRSCPTSHHCHAYHGDCLHLRHQCPVSFMFLEFSFVNLRRLTLGISLWVNSFLAASVREENWSSSEDSSEVDSSSRVITHSSDVSLVAMLFKLVRVA